MRYTAPKREGLAEYLRGHEHPGGIIVCEEPKFIYMKSTKTAGTSILRAGLEKRVPGIFHYKDHPERFRAWIDSVTDEDLKEYFIFSVVRNPWDRFVSVAAHFKIPFKDFAANIHEHRKNKDVRTHSLPLYLYTHVQGEQFVDLVCRFESLQPDMNLVFDRLGLPREEIAFINRSKHEHYTRCYTEKEVRVVQSLYEQDINFFGYMFQYPRSYERGLTARIKRCMWSR